MEFGSVDDATSVRYDLPPGEFRTGVVSKKTRVFLGAPIWNHREMINRIKIPEMDRWSPLKIYAQAYNAIELNSSYYSLPSHERIIQWQAQVPESFRFFVKAPKGLTFDPLNEVPTALLDNYFLCLEQMGHFLGGSFLQFSPYISPFKKRYLFDILESLPTDFPFFIELRHPDWFSDRTRLSRLLDYLTKKKIGFVITDTPGRRDVLHMKFSTPRCVIRFKGNNGHSTDFDRLNDWNHFFERHPHFEEIHFFHHHSDEKFCLDTVKYMGDLWRPRVENFIPEIRFASDRQPSLF